MNHNILFGNLKHLFHILLLLTVASLFWACDNASENREIELSRKETELAKKETELVKKELEMSKGNVSNQTSNGAIQTPSQPTPSLPKVKGRKTVGRTGCDSGHWIDSVSEDGNIIKLEDGSIWEVDSVDTIISTLWLPITEVMVCDDKIINTDDNESVSVTQLK
ncbi:MAG: hypothetical protein ACR2F2_11835 [Pyrinomonadaceae bacterium]